MGRKLFEASIILPSLVLDWGSFDIVNCPTISFLVVAVFGSAIHTQFDVQKKYKMRSKRNHKKMITFHCCSIC